ncbi:hypothetical protein L9F63_020051, partial [Diploptera punctata]
INALQKEIEDRQNCKAFNAHETTERLCVNIHNYSGHDRVVYTKTTGNDESSPVVSLKSSPLIGERIRDPSCPQN